MVKRKAAPAGKPEADDVSGLASDFDNYLNIILDQVEAPKPIPVGSWTLKGLGAKLIPAQTADDVDRVLFSYKPVAAGEDVDPDELAESEWQGSRLWFRARIEGRSDLYGLANHFRKHGIDLSNKTLPQAIDVFNKVRPLVTATVGVRQYTDNTGTPRQDNTLTNFVPVS